jgi:hypothetical protein
MSALYLSRNFLIAGAVLFMDATAFGAQPGESIVLDPATGNYTVTYCNPNGAPPAAGTCVLESFVFVPSTKIVPRLHSRFAVNGAAIEFTYRLNNGATSVQPITELVLEPVSNVVGAVAPGQVTASMDDAALATALDSWIASMATPTGWQPIVIIDSSGTALRTAWLATQDTTNGLAPGKTQGGFGFASTDLPGIGSAQISGNAGLSATLNDDGPTGDIGAQLQTLQTKNYVPRFAALPAIPVPAPFNRAVLIQSVDTQVATWVVLGVLDSVLYGQIHSILQAAITAAGNNDSASCKAHQAALQRLLSAIYPAINPDDDSQDDLPDSPQISRLAARVLLFDVRYAISRAQL